MDVTTHIVAPHTHLARHDSLAGSLDAIFREHHFPPAILQYTFIDRRPATHYTELVNLLTPFPSQPTSEFLEEIGRVVAPAQTRFTTLMSSHYPPVFPPIPATTLYAVPNEDKFVVARSSLQLVRDQYSAITPPVDNFTSEFESMLVMDSDFTDQVRATLKASFIVKTNPDKPSTATLTIGCPSYAIHSGRLQSGRTDRHGYVLHSLSATARQDPITTTPYEFTPHFTPRDLRFERVCNGLRYECTWLWEVLDAELRTAGVGAGADSNQLGAKATGESGNSGDAPAISKPESGAARLPKEYITVTVPLAAASQPNPLHITFTATLTSAAGLDAIDAVHRTGQWADRTTLEGLQRAFDSAHPAMQVVHHVVRIDIPDVSELVRDGLAQEGGTLGGLQGEGIGGMMVEGVYASMPRPNAYSGEVRVSLDRDAGVVGRRGDEDEEGNSDEDG